MLSMSLLLPALPEIVLACACMALLMVGVFRGNNVTRSLSWVAVFSLLLVGFILSSIQTGRMTAFGGQFVVDDFAHFQRQRHRHRIFVQSCLDALN